MAMTVHKRKDTPVNRVFVHKVADIRGGVSVVSKELKNNYLNEGTVISKPIDGMCHVVKYATLQSDATNSETHYKVYKGHEFKVGDVVCYDENSKAYKITAIDESNAGYDQITLSTSLGVALKKDVNALIQAKSEGASGSQFKYEPFALVGTGKVVNPKTNIDTDAWVIGVVRGLAIPEVFLKSLKGIINY